MNNNLLENRRALIVAFSVVVCLSAFSDGLLLSSKPRQTQVGRARDYKRRSATCNHYQCQRHSRVDALLLQSTATDDDNNTIEVDENESDVDEKPKCFWKPKAERSWWQERVNLKDLEVGQQLSGHLVQDLIDGTKTGPKLFFECGVGRTNEKGEWNIVNGMLRLPRGKLSVARKRAARYRQKDSIELFVSRVQPGCGRLEVCATLEEAEMYKKKEKPIPITQLKPGQEVRGTVVKVLPYGAMVNVGANRLGLLHIKKVAGLFAKFIDKEKGMKKFGIEPKAEVRLQVLSVEKRRLELDFTDDVKKEAEDERREKKEQMLQAKKEREEKKAAAAAAKSKKSTTADTSSSQGGPQMSEEELAQWAEYAAQAEAPQTDDPPEDPYAQYAEYADDPYAQYYEDEEKDDDEDRNIEDAFGLGTY